MKVIIYTGKGGVGKTTVSAARAISLASSGRKVIVMSTDQAHSLGDSFGLKLSDSPVKVMDNLYALEIDTVKETEKAWGNIKAYAMLFLNRFEGQTLEVEELLAFPGFDELFALLKLRDYVKKNEYDYLVMDCAPTGETLSLLRFPEMFEDIITKALPRAKKAADLFGSSIEKTVKIPVPKQEVFDEIAILNDRLRQLKNILKSGRLTSINIVATPERVVILESKRNFEYLTANGFPVKSIVVNKIYPSEAMEGYFSKWASLQESGLRDIKEFFKKLNIYYLELQNEEICGIDKLKETAKTLFQ